MANEYKTSGGVTIGIEPFFSEGYILKSMELNESLGGIIANGVMSLSNDGSENAMKLITDLYYFTIKLKKEEGLSYEIPCFITSREFSRNFLNLEFLCISDKEFYTDIKTLDWPDINSALNGIWTGKKDIRCESDLNNDLLIKQCSESSYSFSGKLGLGYKKNAVFAIGLNGFLIKDLIGIDSSGNKEPFYTLYGDQSVFQETGYYINYNYRLYKDMETPWVDGGYTESKNLAVYNFDNKYFVCHKDYKKLLENYYWNTNLMISKFYSSLSIVHPHTLPEFRLGDTIRYRRTEDKTWLPFKTYIVSKMTIFIVTEDDTTDEHGLKFSVTSTLRGLDENGEILPTIDPVK